MSRKDTKMDGYEKQILTMKKAGKTKEKLLKASDLSGNR